MEPRSYPLPQFLNHAIKLICECKKTIEWSVAQDDKNLEFGADITNYSSLGMLPPFSPYKILSI